MTTVKCNLFSYFEFNLGLISPSFMQRDLGLILIFDLDLALMPTIFLCNRALENQEKKNKKTIAWIVYMYIGQIKTQIEHMVISSIYF